MKICSTVACGRPVLAKGLCSFCYEHARYRKPGFAEAKKAYQKTPERKAYSAVYSKTDQFKQNQKRYQATDKFEAAQTRYRMKTPNKFSAGKRQAAKRGVIWEITYEQYLEIVKTNKCHYCPNNLTKYGHDLDRKDNSKGYKIDNVVPCCKDCNRTKGDRLSYDEMVAVAKLLMAMRGQT